ncbi:hypothetical protein CEXT_13921 [Caerostris extrusa]|uniref:Uncharacterized protein n=1 Tax=Caerostris extrusa TaxID=172846 RepID=A0AAV4SSK4_CAEEX|nr:hypothetical protein CEXT_13921 [Caerostris extrusa]
MKWMDIGFESSCSANSWDFSACIREFLEIGKERTFTRCLHISNSIEYHQRTFMGSERRRKGENGKKLHKRTLVDIGQRKREAMNQRNAFTFFTITVDS